MALLAQKFEPFSWMPRSGNKPRFKTGQNAFIAFEARIVWPGGHAGVNTLIGISKQARSIARPPRGERDIVKARI
jgi:hypothetical protein